MDYLEDGRLPRESKSQRYGKEAVQAFDAARPQTWSIHPLEGDDDYGLDKQIQVPDPELEGRIIGLFYAQIKGSTDNLLSSDGNHFSVALKVTTLNYYTRIQDPVMLVFSDLSEGLDPRDSPVYWTWISEDIQELLDGKSDFAGFDQKTITFHVPTKNQITRDFNVVTELANFRRRANALKGLCHSLNSTTGEDVSLEEAITTISQAVSKHGEPLINAFLDSQDSRWIDPPTGSIPEILKQAELKISENRDIEAKEFLDQAKSLITTDTSNSEKADYEYLTGRVNWIQNDIDSAIDHYSNAQQLDKDIAKYHVAFIEAKFSRVYPDDMLAVRTIFDSIRTDDIDEILCIKARILGALGNIKEAFKLIEHSTSKASSVARALLSYLDQDWNTTIEYCELGLQHKDLDSNAKSLFLILISRSLYYQCFKDQGLDSNYIISTFGTNDMDFTLTDEAWNAAKIALRQLKHSKWPSNSVHIVDVINILASSLNREKEVLVDLNELSLYRPYLHLAHEALYRLASIHGDHELALIALARLPDNTDTLHKKIMSLYDQRRYKDVLALSEEKLLSSDKSSQFYGISLGMAALSAHALLNQQRAAPFEKELIDSSDLAEHAAVFNYIYTCNENPLSCEEALVRFCDDFRTHPDSITIQDNLFFALNTHKEDEAKFAIEVVDKIIKRRRLAVREITHLAQAYTTLRDWDSLLNVVNDAITQYGETPLLESIRALAFEGKGDTANALKILESIISSNHTEELAIEYYIYISARNGFHQQAIDQLETLYQNTTSNKDQIYYLHQMFSLEMSLNPNSTRLFDIAWRYGQLCNQNNEEEEGIFIQMYLMSTLQEDIKVASEQKNHFNERSTTYFRQFPNSKIIKRLDIPHDSKPEAFKKMLYDITGVTPKSEQWFKRIENQLQRGELIAPFAWRPKRLLVNISDIAYLWYVAKKSAREAHGYHLHIFFENEPNCANITRGPCLRPLCDLTTLIILAELHILELAFDILGTIAISKTTIYEIQRLGYQQFGGYILFQEISRILRKNLSKIEQPGHFNQTEFDNSIFSASLEETATIAQSGKYVLYVDDAFARQYIRMSHDTIETFTTLDLLAEAERRGLITAREVSEKLAQLIDWRVVVEVKARYFISAIPISVTDVVDLNVLNDILLSDKTYSQMINGLWDFRLGYNKIMNHWAYMLFYIAHSKEAPIELITALWCTWLDKVKFRTNPSLMPLEHAAWSFILSATIADKDKLTVKRLWSAYILLIEIIYFPQMDEQKEQYARSFAGRIAAKLADKKEEAEARDKILETVLSGLVQGTAEYECFTRGYESERIRLEKNHTE